jgi:hypothetical protein
MQGRRGASSPFKGIKTPPHSPRAEERRPFSETHPPLSRASSGEARAKAQKLLDDRQISVRPAPRGLSVPAGANRRFDLVSALERLTTLVRTGLLVGEFARGLQDRVSGAIRMKAGCDPDELAGISETLEAEGEQACAFQLRAALAMNASAVDDRFMANLGALMRLEPNAGPGLGEPMREALVVHCRTLRALLSRNALPCFGDLGYVGSLDEPFHTLNRIIVWLERRWMLSDPMSMNDKVGLHTQHIEPDTPLSARRRTFSSSDGFDLRKLTLRVSNGRQWSGRTGWLLDSSLEQAFTALLDKRLVTCLRTVDDDVDSEILGFTLQPGCDSDTVANVAAALVNTEPALAMLLWAAWAMNETRADNEFMAAIRSVLELKRQIEMPPPSLWKILGQLLTHALALKVLGRASAPELLLDLCEPLYGCSVLRGGDLLGAMSTRTREVADRIVAALGGDEPASPRLGFSLWGPGASHDVETVASDFDRTGQPGLALQLLSVHITQLATLAEADLPCVHLATGIAASIDLLDGPAMQAMRLLLLHGRLLRHCGMVAGPQCDEALASMEASLIEQVLVSTGGTTDLLPIGTLDGVCCVLGALADVPHSDTQRRQIVQAAACLAAVDSGPGRRRVERSMRWAARAGGWTDLPDAKGFAVLSEQHRERLIKQLRLPLRQHGIAWNRGKFTVSSGTHPWTPSCCKSAVTMAHVRLCRPGRTSAAGEASALIQLLHCEIDLHDIASRASLLALGLRCAATDPKVLDEALCAVLDALVAQDGVLRTMLEGDVSDLPVVICTLALQARWLQDQVRRKGIRNIVDSAEFAATMASGSAPCLLDEALARIGADPLSLQRKATRRLLRRMLTPSARRGSMKALARPMLSQTLRDSSLHGAALIEGLLLLGRTERQSFVEPVMTAVMNALIDDGTGAKRAHLQALKSLLGQPIAMTWSRLSTQGPPGFVMAVPNLLATWLGTGVADLDAPGRLPEQLAAVLRQQRRSRGSEWRDSVEGLVFAIRVAVRASAGLSDEMLDAVGTPTPKRGSSTFGRSELFAHASLLACRDLLKAPVPPVADATQIELLACLMRAALALDMEDPFPCRDHLQWAAQCESKVEPGLLPARWFSEMRAKLHTGLQALTA